MPRLFNHLAQQPVLSAIPGDGVFIDNEGQADNALVSLYTVPVSHILYVYNYYLNVNFIGAGYGYISVYDNSPAYKYRIDYMGGKIGDNNHNSQIMQPPLSLSAGESIQIFSSAANVIVNAGFFGYRWYIL